MVRPPRHILLIQGSADDRANLRQMLMHGSSNQYRFSDALLGAEGVRRVLDRQAEPVDCVLLDYDLPDTNALGVLADLRSEDGMPPCPVVVISGTEIADGLTLLASGAQDYVQTCRTCADDLTLAVEKAMERFALIAARRRAKAELRRSEERYRALFDSIDAGIAVIEMEFDAHGAALDARYLQVNPAFARQTGIADAEGRTLRELVPGVERLWLEAYGSVALTGEPVHLEQRVETLQRWFHIYAFRLQSAKPREVAVLFNDITERKQIELALTAAKGEAERANRAKSDFLLSMSHELRSPLSAMLGFTQLIESGTPTPTPAQQDSVQQILHAGWYLLGLINEILDLTAIESGTTVVSSQAVLLNDVLADCRAMIEPQAHAAGIDLRFPMLEQPFKVQADATRTKQVLLNLLTNAIKYNRNPGSVEVRCTVVPGQRVRLSVEDTGPGLSAAQLRQLFEPFNRLGQETGGEPGTGIGLVISKRLVDLMGGCIGVESVVGEGSCFWFELTATPALLTRSLPVHTVLCIENDATRLQRVEELVAGWPSVGLLRARDICGGIEIARSARPDAILMGIPLLDPGAVQAMLLLRKNPATAHIPVIALAADATPLDIEAGRAAGCFDYLTQPVRSDAFGRALELAFLRTHANGDHATAQENR
jgi:PAS domain S-box-containing protein